MAHIGHFIPYTGTAMGGPVIGMAACTSLLADVGYSITVFSAHHGADGASVQFDSRVTLVQGTAARAGGFRRSRTLWQQASAADMQLIHSHCLWTDVNRLAGELARRRCLPHLLAPCGMLAPRALRHHWWKKVPARLWFQDRALREAQCLHAKSHKEYEDIRRYGLRNPVAIVANPIFPPPWQGASDTGHSACPAASAEPAAAGNAKAAADRRSFPLLTKEGGRGRSAVVCAEHAQRPPSGPPFARGDTEGCPPKSADYTPKMHDGTSGRAEAVTQPAAAFLSGKEEFAQAFRRNSDLVEDKRIALFLGRLHRTKGPARLVEAWSAVREQHPDWILVLAGPDEGGYRREVESLVADLRCAESVVFTGELDSVQKWRALAAADLFVMPSDFENFGNSIVEAMLCGLPVITTTGTPWRRLPETGAGWWVPATADELAVALREALAMSDAQRQAMGRHALQLADRFRPERSVHDLSRVYRWLLSEGERPECVRME